MKLYIPVCDSKEQIQIFKNYFWKINAYTTEKQAWDSIENWKNENDVLEVYATTKDTIDMYSI